MSRKNGRNTPAAAPPEQPKVDENNLDEIPLDETSGLAMQLAQSRLNEAQLAVQLRQRDVEATYNKIKEKYEEGGKYTFGGINFQKGVIVRTVNEKKVEETPPPATPGSN